MSCSPGGRTALFLWRLARIFSAPALPSLPAASPACCSPPRAACPIGTGLAGVGGACLGSAVAKWVSAGKKMTEASVAIRLLMLPPPRPLCLGTSSARRLRGRRVGGDAGESAAAAVGAG
jgi:hypothetical protein